MLPLGGAVATGPGKLRMKAIIHVAGIDLLWRSSEWSIRESVRNAMTIVKGKGYESVAFPLIGAGTGGGKAERVLEWMRGELATVQYDGMVIVVKHLPRGSADLPDR